MNSSRISELLNTYPKTTLFWGMYLLSPEKSNKPDLGIAVAKKLVKRAVDRNRLKRMIRELIWAAQSTNLKSDVVVKLKKPIGRETRGKLRKKEQNQLRKQIEGLL